ncbi:MAG TPA: NAD(+) synthase [bacterium]|mgnify:CR=1 FL=1|nr:NAD(+) synthase [bacterium]
MEQLLINPKQISLRLQAFVKQKVQKYHRNGVILGLSGGLDSAVVAALAVRSLGAENVLALIMPERDSDPCTVSDAKLVARQYNIREKVINLTPELRKLNVYKLQPRTFLIPRSVQKRYVEKKEQELGQRLGISPFLAILRGTDDVELRRSVAYFRAKHRLRMWMLYFYAELENLLVLGTSNKTEWMTGFFVPYGDGAADIMPLLSLYKTQVRELAQFLEVPQRIIEKAPSPDLIPGITDEGVLGLSYDKLDEILFSLEQGFTPEQVASLCGIPFEKVQFMKQIITNSEHLRRMPEIVEEN